MSRPQQVARPLVLTLRQATATAAAQSPSCPLVVAVRQFSSTPARKNEPTTRTTASPAGTPDPVTEAALLSQKPSSRIPSTIKTGSPDELSKFLDPSLGSQRRRAAMATTGDLPFTQLPYQCFQEARKLLAQDRAEKVAKIIEETEKIKRLEATDPSVFRGGEAYKQKRLASLRKYVEQLKILADINDPEVKRRFEDGKGMEEELPGDMNKPIYRYLAHRKWCSMDRKIIMQRIEQFHIVPDLLPKFEPIMDVKLKFRGYKIQPGAILNSAMTENPPTLRMQVFDKGERLFSIVVVDSDVPQIETDSFGRRLHFMATNIPWDPTRNSLPLSRLGRQAAAPQQPSSESSDCSTATPSSSLVPAEKGDLVIPWLPPFAQKGSPYHRLSVFILRHNKDQLLDVNKLKELYNGRDGFSVKSFRDKFGLTPVGFTMFRTEWDDNTADIMKRHNIPGWDIEFKRPRVHSAKPPRKPRGWEAKRQGPKYRHLWKYTKRIRGIEWSMR